MKRCTPCPDLICCRAVILAGLIGLAGWPVSGRDVRLADARTNQVSEDSAAAEAPTSEPDAEVTIQPMRPRETTRKDVPWLGVSTAEVSEALAAQLELEPGVGLLITYVVPDSPAAKSGLRKNDVLTQFGDQALVHPAQLRKLVRVRQDGESVKLGFYRSGKHQTVSVTLGKTRNASDMLESEEHELKGDFKELQKQFRDLHIDDAVRDQMRALRDSLGNLKFDQKEVQEDIRHGMEQARKAIQEAMRSVTNTDLGPLRKMFENLARSGVTVDNKADVVVRSSSHSVKTVVKSDEAGTIVLLCNPKLHLTAHDKDGKLIFDGSIDSTEEQAKVPRALWERLEPLVEQMRAGAEQPEVKADE